MKPLSRSRLLILALAAWLLAPLAARAGGPALDQRAALALAQPEAEEAYGPLTLKSAQPYDALDGGPGAWALEFESAKDGGAVAALVIPGAGVQEPTVKVWSGEPYHLNADALAAAALAIHDRLGVTVGLPVKFYWAAPAGIWAAYAEKDPRTGKSICYNLVAQQAGDPAAPSASAKLSPAHIERSALFGGDVDYPTDEGIIWLRGQTYTVEWSGFDGDQVLIELFKGTSRVQSRTTDNDGATAWSVANDAKLAANYRFKITARNNPLAFDWSDHDFAIASNRYHVISPSDSGITWKRGSTYSIQWEGFGGDHVKIQLYLGSLLIDTRTTDNDGQTDWTVDGNLVSSSDYKIKISEESNSSHADWSDNSFKITGSSAKVSYPSASGITWKRGNSYTVKWSGYDGDNVQVELWKGGVLKSFKITENDGSLSWKVDKGLSSGSDYKIRIFSLAYPLQTDWSDKSFKIK